MYASLQPSVTHLCCTTAFGRASEDGVDEYLDEEDCGYVRQDIRGQDAFVAREIDATDDDGTARGSELYHQALAYAGQAWPLPSPLALCFAGNSFQQVNS